MNEKIRVHVVRYRECRNLVLWYKDPLTGKYRRSTSYTDPQTGQKFQTGTNRKEARKLAGLWEADLNAGRDRGQFKVGWQEFRNRYETEAVPALADWTANKVETVFNAVERFLPKIATGRVTDLTAEAISRWQAELRARRLSENTIGSYLAHLRAALAWAADQGMLPKIKRPQRATKRGGGRSKGRPVTGEGFDRMLAAVPAALHERRKRQREASREYGRKRGAKPRKPRKLIPVELDPAAVESWRHPLRGLWLSGLRLEESTVLSWDRHAPISVDLSGRRPRLRIDAEAEKGHQDRLLPITPDFAEFLLATPEAERRGWVFRPMQPGGVASYDATGRMLSLIGELARVVVHTDRPTGKAK
ncbi:MAG: phage integrase SAM-like domain-containing protein [Planctomycetota bacterium]